MRRFYWSVCGVLYLLISGIVVGGDSSSHTITIRVIHPVEMNIETHSVKQQRGESSINQKAEPVNQQLTSVLKWKSDQVEKKITVSTEQQGAHCQVQIEGLHCIGGVVSHGFDVDQLAHDFITDISTSWGQCEVRTLIDTDSFYESDPVLPRLVYTITEIY